MNLVVMMGRLTRDPEVRYGIGPNGTQVANYRLAVDRRFKREGQPDADFFDCTVFGRQVEFVEKYLHQGTKIVIQGRLQNDNYQDKEGRTVYRNKIIVDSQEFAESKAASQQNAGAYRAPRDPASEYGEPAAQAPRPAAPAPSPADDEDFMNIPSGLEEELPF